MSLDEWFLTLSRTVVTMTLQNVGKYLPTDMNDIPEDFLLQDRVKAATNVGFINCFI
jgi:hypothetical protein